LESFLCHGAAQTFPKYLELPALMLAPNVQGTFLGINGHTAMALPHEESFE
jgi:hypothetical protein